MTREEVVKWLKSLKMEIGKTENRTLWHYAESIDMAIEALNCSEKPTSSNLISRQDALRIVDQFSREEMFHYMESLELDMRATQICHSAIEAVGTIKEQIEALPSADRLTGEWVSNHDGSWNCSECGLRVFIYAKGNYCPNCGAKMNKGGEDE